MLSLTAGWGASSIAWKNKSKLASILHPHSETGISCQNLLRQFYVDCWGDSAFIPWQHGTYEATDLLGNSRFCPVTPGVINNQWRRETWRFADFLKVCRCLILIWVKLLIGQHVKKRSKSFEQFWIHSDKNSFLASKKVQVIWLQSSTATHKTTDGLGNGLGKHHHSGK